MDDLQPLAAPAELPSSVGFQPMFMHIGFGFVSRRLGGSFATGAHLGGVCALLVLCFCFVVQHMLCLRGVGCDTVQFWPTLGA